MNSIARSLLGLVTLVALSAVPGAAQTYSSIGVGIATPTGDFSTFYDNGYTVRGQVGLSLVLADVHVQTGWTRFPFTEEAGGSDGGNIDVYHAGVGARVGLGVIWVGANGAYFFGEGDNEIGFFPEVGVGLGPIEVVADYRLGDVNYFGLRGALKF